MKAKPKTQDATMADPLPDPGAPAQISEQVPDASSLLQTTDVPAAMNDDPAPAVAATAVINEAPSDAPKIALAKVAAQSSASGIRTTPRSAEQVQAVIAQIKADAESLSDTQRAHLHTVVAANPMRDLNARCFAQVHTFRHMTILFSNLRANSKAFLSIRPDQVAIWSEGGAQSRMVGLSFSAIAQPTMFLRNFLINAREMYLETNEDCTAIELTLYVRTEQHQLKGKVDLPPGATVTLTSRSDRTSVVGLSSFGIDLE